MLELGLEVGRFAVGFGGGEGVHGRAVVVAEDVDELHDMIDKHYRYTGSPRAKMMLDDWDIVRRMFVKVFPMEYRRALGQMKKVERFVRRTEGEKVEQA